jgi:hypothetical protein
MSDMRLVEMVNEEGFIVPVPCETEALLGSIARGAIAEGVDDMEGVREAEGVIEEWALEGVAVLDGAVDAGWGLKDVFIFVGWRSCNSFSANITS